MNDHSSPKRRISHPHFIEKLGKEGSARLGACLRVWLEGRRSLGSAAPLFSLPGCRVVICLPHPAPGPLAQCFALGGEEAPEVSGKQEGICLSQLSLP